jgi:hypothetical protein
MSAHAFRSTLEEIDFPDIGLEIEASENGRLRLRQMRPQRDIQRERFIQASVREPGRSMVVFDDALRATRRMVGDLELTTAAEGALVVRSVGHEARLPLLPSNFMQLPSNALQPVECFVYEERNDRGERKVRLRMARDGLLVLSGEDTGSQVSEFFGTTEYEWRWTLDASTLPRLLASLGLQCVQTTPERLLIADARAELLEQIRTRLLKLEREQIQEVFRTTRASFGSWYDR